MYHKTMKLLPVMFLSNVVTTVLCHKFVAEESEMFLKEINTIRRKVDPTPSKMLEVNWSDDLATIATTYASECTRYLNPARNNQSAVFNQVGELHYVGRLKDAMSFSSLLVDAALFWISNKLDITRNVSTTSLCHTQDYIQVYIVSFGTVLQ